MDILYSCMDIAEFYINKYFLKHPKDVCMTYIQHFLIAIYISCFFMKGCVTSVIHAFIPSFFLTSASDTANKIKDIINENGCREVLNEKKEN